MLTVFLVAERRAVVVERLEVRGQRCRRVNDGGRFRHRPEHSDRDGWSRETCESFRCVSSGFVNSRFHTYIVTHTPCNDYNV